MLEALNQVSVLSMSTHPVFAQMVNVGFGPAGILGLCLAGAGAGLYLLRSTRPELARDYDIFFSAIGLLCGGILFFNGWRLDPILMFGQVLMAGSAVFFAFESIRLRSITTDQARRGGGRQPIVDDDRAYSVDRVYRAELDEIEPFMEDRPPVRRIRGARDSEASDRAAYDDGYSSDSYDSSAYSGAGYSGRSSRRSSARRSSRASRDEYGSSAYDSSYGESADYGSAYKSNDRTDSDSNYSSSGYSSPRRSSTSDWETPTESRRPSSSRRRASSSRDRYEDEPPAPRSSRRPRNSGASTRNRRDSRGNNDDYVDYKPISNYSESSSSAYGSRRPSRDYDDEWGS